MRNQKIPFIEASGTNYEVGFQIGQTCRKKIERLIEISKVKYPLITGKPFEHFMRRGKRVLVLCQRHYPRYINEIQGIADGAGLDFYEYFALNFEDEAIDFANKCTTLLLRTREGILLGHNEDWTRDFLDELYILKLKQKDKPNLLILSYLGPPQFIVACLNSAGIAFTGNSLYATHKFGVPEALMLRSMADAKNINEAIKDLTVNPRAMGGNSMIISRKRVVDVEASLNKSAVIEVKGDWFVHTNHSLRLKGKHWKNSVTRFDRATEMLKQSEIKDIDLLRRILSDHKNYPDSICCHTGSKGEKIKWRTIASIIIDPIEMRILIAHGNPCESRFREYALKD